MSVFGWPTALWFVSGATTVVSPIGSSACFSARSPRDSTPSSFVTRIRGRVVQSASGPGGRAQCARPAAPGAAGERLAPLLVDIAALDPGPLAGHVGDGRSRPRPLSSSSLTPGPRPGSVGSAMPSPVGTCG